MNTEQTKKEITLEDLAQIIAKRIDDMEEKMDGRFDKIEVDVKTLGTDVGELRADVSTLKTDVAGIKETVGNIEADLNKKIDMIAHNDLTYRVEKLEKKFA